MHTQHQKRRYERVKGPFSGRHLGPSKTHVFVYDLNLGGGFVRFTGAQPPGSSLKLEIKLPGEGPVTVNAERVYPDEAGWPVRFVDVPVETAVRLARTVDAMKHRANSQSQQRSVGSF